MLPLQGWELALLAVAAFVALAALVRLMRIRSDQLTQELLLQADSEHQHKREEDRKAKRKQRPV